MKSEATTETTKRNHTDFDKVEKTHNMFEREARVGFNFLNLRSGKPHHIEVLEFISQRENKKGGKNDFWKATDLQTGEEGEIYIDGGLKGQFAAMGGPSKAVGMRFEITHKGVTTAWLKNPTTGEPEEQEVNSYDVFKLKTPKQ